MHLFCFAFSKCLIVLDSLFDGAFLLVLFYIAKKKNSVVDDGSLFGLINNSAFATALLQSKPEWPTTTTTMANESELSH